MRPGEPWGEPLDPAAEVVDAGTSDSALSVVAGEHPGAVLRFGPVDTSDFGRALGLPLGASPSVRRSQGTVLACDLMDLGGGRTAVNAVVLGTAPDRLRWWHRAHPVRVEVDGRAISPDRATTVVVASGQFLRGANLVPRGHPGDGRIEIQVYALGPGERRAMRSRLATGDHVPHPRIAQASGRRVVVAWAAGPHPMEVDGCPVGASGRVTIEVRPGAARVLI